MSNAQSTENLKLLKAFEDRVDEAVAAMPLANLPARPLLVGIHFFLYSIRHAALFGRPEHPGVADTIMTRLSHLLPIAVTCPSEPFGGDAEDALAAFREVDPDGQQLMQLFTYLHFSELMPEAHRDYYAISSTAEGFVLTHRDAAFAEAQARDILLSELALVFPLRSDNALDPALRKIIGDLPKIDWNLLGPFLAGKVKRLLFNLAEPNIVTPDAMQRIFGFGYSKFYRIRASLLAYAEFSLEVSMVLGASSHRDQKGEGISAEALEWVTVNHEAGWFVSLIADLSRTDTASVERFLAYFTIDFRENPAKHHGGDGLFPPFARFEQSFVFSPIHVLSTLHMRNAIFAFASMDRHTFSAHVANELEPVLIGQALELFRCSGSWTLKKNVEHDGGEIDVIVAGDDGPVLLLEAKGPLSPQGARLTERLADRTREGLSQIDRFKKLEREEREEVVGRAIGRDVADTDLRYGILARSCFGAVEAFDVSNGIHRVTLPLLSIALGEMRAAAEQVDVTLLIERLSAAEERFYRDAAPVWRAGAIEIAERTLTVPVLDFDHDLVDFVRTLSWESSIIGETTKPTDTI